MFRPKRERVIDATPRELAQVLGLTRLVLGAGMAAFPRLAARLWLGDEHASASTRVTMIGFGARDVALGMGTLLALERGTPVRGWLEAGIVADAADTASVLLTPGIGPARKLLSLAASGFGVLWGASLLDELE